MSRVRVLTVVGARPQFIKAAAVGRAMAEARAAGHELEEILVHTGQHYDREMSGDLFEELGLGAPSVQLGIGSDTPVRQVSRMMIGVGSVLSHEDPDVVLLYGDTNSTIAGALAAAKLDIASAHVEAGLRSFDRSMPEEVNRVVTDHLASVHFAPSTTAAEQLASEGVRSGVHVVGDVMLDVMRWRRASAERDEHVLRRHGVSIGDYLFATVHRQATTDAPDRLAEVVEALVELSTRHPVLFSVHPRTRPLLPTRLDHVSGVRLLPPLPYAETLSLVACARAVLTDSGGLQKEAFWNSTPCVTLRDETEWTETVDEGWNRLVGTDRRLIIGAVAEPPPEQLPTPVYGTGEASRRIVDVLLARGWSR